MCVQIYREIERVDTRHNTERFFDNLEHILAIELMNAAQGIDFRRPQKTSPVLERFLHAYRKEVPFVKDDIVMYKEIHKTVAFLKRTQIEY